MQILDKTIWSAPHLLSIRKTLDYLKLISHFICVAEKNHILTLKLSDPTLTTAILPLDRPVEIVAVEPNTVVLATNIPFAVYTAIFVPEGIPLIESILPMEGCHIRL